ncbi:hemolysin activation/secretion protein [Herbaspirillum seropedicae]|nr:POTRA domain-containing protein [Herbaspirillum seropedicae]MDR6397356.1 hemolysin activation/secretion protein [Herbaspirillum seropedicae]
MSSAWAQADLSTQQFQRQQERERELRRQQERGPDVRLPAQPGAAAEAVPAQESPCFAVHRVVLDGPGSARFAWLLDLPEANPGGRCLGVQGINAVMSALQNAIVARGYVTTRLLAQPQDIASGELRLTIVPGKIRAIRFADNADPRATQWNALPASPGDLLNLRDIEQGLENLKRVPTAEADIQIAPSEGKDAAPGDSDLVISYQQGIPIRLTLSVDDSGTKATGKYQGSATVSLDNWLNFSGYLGRAQSVTSVGSTVNAGGDLTMVAQRDLSLTAAQVAIGTNGSGNGSLMAGRAVTIGVALVMWRPSRSVSWPRLRPSAARRI